MIAIGLRFPAGRYHATPWGRHVNEAVPEWPPSPWRLLRALVASWKIKASELDEPEVKALLQELSAPPSFYLPPATTGHTRHYMRWYKKGPEDQTLVFDAFVCLDRESDVAIIWPEVTLEESLTNVLRRLLNQMGYLGRAESWCEARLLDEFSGTPNAWPVNGENPSASQELVRIVCADTEKAFGNEYVTKQKFQGRGKNKTTVVETPYDPAWNLCMDTAQLHKEKWSDLPGSKWVTYVRASDCLDPPRKARLYPCPSRPQTQVVRYALDSSVLPLVTETLPVAEAARWALMSLYNAGETKSEMFSGKDADGNRLSGHRHAYFLPTDEDGDGRLDYLTVYAADGFPQGEMTALDKLRTIKQTRRDAATHPLRVLLLGMGLLDDGYRPGPLAKSRVWESATPYIAARYAKTRGKNRVDLGSIDAVIEFLVEDLRRQVGEILPKAGDPADLKIEPMLEGNAFKVAGRRPIQFKRFRQKSNDDGGRRLAGSFRIEFPRDVSGPIALGHSSHFGLGLFMPA